MGAKILYERGSFEGAPRGLGSVGKFCLYNGDQRYPPCKGRVIEVPLPATAEIEFSDEYEPAGYFTVPAAEFREEGSHALRVDYNGAGVVFRVDGVPFLELRGDKAPDSRGPIAVEAPWAVFLRRGPLPEEIPEGGGVRNLLLLFGGKEWDSSFLSSRRGIRRVEFRSWSGLRDLSPLPPVRELLLSGNSSLTSFEGLPTTVESLVGRHMGRLKDLSDLGGRENLKELRLDSLPLISPESPKGFPALEALELTNCSRLTTVRGLFPAPRLKRLSLAGDDKLRSLEGVEGSPELEDLNIGGCVALTELSPLKGNRALLSLDVSACTALIGPPVPLPSLLRLRGSRCSLFIDPHRLAAFPNIQELVLNEHPSLASLEPLQELTKLQSLTLEECFQIGSQKGLSRLSSLRVLNLCYCGKMARWEKGENPPLTKLILVGAHNLEDLSFLSTLPTLRYLDLSYNRFLQDFSVFKALEGLETLHLHGTSLRSLKGVGALKSLKTLDLGSSKRLRSLSGIESAEALIDLDINDCEGIGGLECLRGLTSLRRLSLVGCTSITSLKSLENLVGLESINLWGCKNLKSLEGLQNLKALQEVNIEECYALESVDPLDDLPSLRRLLVSGSQAERYKASHKDLAKVWTVIRELGWGGE